MVYLVSVTVRWFFRGDQNGRLVFVQNCRTLPHQCEEIICHVGEMKPKSQVSIDFKGDLMITPLRRNKLSSQVTSSLTFKIDKYPYPVFLGKSGPTIASEVSTLVLQYKSFSHASKSDRVISYDYPEAELCLPSNSLEYILCRAKLTCV